MTTETTANQPGDMRCPNCGTAFSGGTRFCANCGADLGSGGGPRYPVRFEVDYPDSLGRLSTLFRVILIVPLVIVLGILGGSDFVSSDRFGDEAKSISVGALGSLVIVHWIAVFLRRRPVVWLFDTIVAINRFEVRAASYFLLMTDRYPPFEGDWGVRYEVDRPETLSRWQLFVWKTVASIPHFIALVVLWFVVLVLTFVAWFAILFTGRYPRGLYDFVSGFVRWGARVGAYWTSLTDEYPPFSLK